jgi:hypothetical protein
VDWVDGVGGYVVESVVMQNIGGENLSVDAESAIRPMRRLSVFGF